MPTAALANTTAPQEDQTLLGKRIFCARIERLANLAGNIDYMKSAIPDVEQRARVTTAVAALHEVAMHYDQLHAWGLYAKDDIEVTGVNEVAP